MRRKNSVPSDTNWYYLSLRQPYIQDFGEIEQHFFKTQYSDPYPPGLDPEFVVPEDNGETMFRVIEKVQDRFQIDEVFKIIDIMSTQGEFDFVIRKAHDPNACYFDPNEPGLIIQCGKTVPRYLWPFPLTLRTYIVFVFTD